MLNFDSASFCVNTIKAASTYSLAISGMEKKHTKFFVWQIIKSNLQIKKLIV